MGRKKIPGMYKRNEIWHIDKIFRGRRICESTGESDFEKAEEYLIRKFEEVRQATVYGHRPQRSFRQAATKFLEECQKSSLRDSALHLKHLDPFIGDLALDSIHMGSLQPFIQERKKQGVKARTINYGLQTVRHLLNLAASEWIDEYGLTWLESAPKIKLLTQQDARKPYPLSWEEQVRLFDELPEHIANMALFKVNTGCREQEVCSLKWDWEVAIPEMGTSVFIIPEHAVKNREERLVILNKTAYSVIERVRGQHPEYVFTYKGNRVGNINSTAWQKARVRAGLEQVRVHDLKHTYGRRLRAAGVSFEDRQDLLGHKSGRITTHYSEAELQNLIDAANSVCTTESRKSSALVILKRKRLTSQPVSL